MFCVDNKLNVCCMCCRSWNDLQFSKGTSIEFLNLKIGIVSFWSTHFYWYKNKYENLIKLVMIWRFIDLICEILFLKMPFSSYFWPKFITEVKRIFQNLWKSKRNSFFFKSNGSEWASQLKLAINVAYIFP